MVMLNQNYSQWPDDPKERCEMAREIWGRDLVQARDGWLKTARGMLFEGEHEKRPTPERKKIEDWIAQLKPEERDVALTFVKEIVDGVVFSILNVLDGNRAGSWIAPVQTEYRLALEVTDKSYHLKEPTEVIDLDSAEAYDFHEQWFDWIDRYGEFGSTF